MSQDNIKAESEAFINFLVKKKGLNLKVAKDTVSRCNRLTRDLNIDLSHCTKNQENYAKFCALVRAYCLENCKTTIQIYALGGMLRKASRYYCEFKWGKKVTDQLNTPRTYI